MVCKLASDPPALGSISNIPQKIYRGKIVYVAEVNQRRCQEERGLWLENVDRTHLVLAGGKLERQKVFNFICSC